MSLGLSTSKWDLTIAYLHKCKAQHFYSHEGKKPHQEDEDN